ncbi:chitinase [Vibrio ostreicida]|nr:chitinase [Vibrio ostreicida]
MFRLSTLSATCLLAFNSYAAMDCSNLEQWDATQVYWEGDQIQYQNVGYQAAFWTLNNIPSTHSGDWQEWKRLDSCSNGGGSENQIPTVTLTSPVVNDAYVVGETVLLVASATDTDGQIERVAFYVDGALIGQSSSAPYQASWTATEGSHTLSVVATDNDEGDSEASSVTLMVEAEEGQNVPPVVTLNVSQSSVSLGDAVTLTADATDSDGEIAQVEFFVGGTSVGTMRTSPYQFDYVTDRSGQLSVFAKATDDQQTTSDSTPVILTVNSDAVSQRCRPDGLHQTVGVDVPYCDSYDENGREKMGSDHPRRMIGYFTSWRAGDDKQAAYLVSDIPWQQLTHVNYAFVSIGSDGKVNIGDVNDPDNPAVGKQWPGVDIDPALGFKGHFGALATYKKKYDVKTMISIGGWAETGGHFDDDGVRVADGGFYSMTTNADGSINHQGIDTFAQSAVDLIRRYKFDGVDIDYEYPTSMAGAGNPDDADFMEPRRAHLWAAYQELMKVLREKLDRASAADDEYYMLTIASPSSGYLLRGMEDFDVTKYLDYVNIMSYDLHGAWNDHVGHNASLYDTGKDSELEQWGVYSEPAYKGIGYLNTDWAYHYFRGSMPAGRINIGVPYYTRGWKGVTGGNNGLWGRAALPDQSQCPPGTGVGEKNHCGNGAVGIDNMWHDTDPKGNEMGAGSNPMWHAKNLENGILGTYVQAYGLHPEINEDDKLQGEYSRYFDDVAVAPWLWNSQKKVFLSTEDDASVRRKADYVADKEIGGIMVWELAGDYNCYLFDDHGERSEHVDLTEQACESGQGEFHMGNTLTKIIYDRFTTATPYGNTVAENETPAESVDISVAVKEFDIGDSNYPISPKVEFTNHSDVTLAGGTEFQFDIPTSAPDNAIDWSGANLSVLASGHSRDNNIGGLDGNMHRISVTLPAYQQLAPGDSFEFEMVYYMPISGPANYTLIANGQAFAFAFEHPELPQADLSDGGSDGGNNGGGTTDPEDVIEWVPGQTQVSNGDTVRVEGECYVAQNNPGPWETPSPSSTWFWQQVPCP